MGELMKNGIMLAFLTALISGISVFLNGTAIQLSDAFVYTTLKNIGALVFLFALFLILKQHNEVKNLTIEQWKNLVLIGVIGGSVPFLLFFWGLKLEGAVIGSFLYRSLFIFGAIFGYVMLQEKITKKHLAGGLVILAGNALLIKGDLVLGFGSVLILAATVMWAIEYTISRKVLKSEVSPGIVATSRMFFGALVLLGFLAATGRFDVLFAVSEVQFQWLIITSLSLFIFISLWYNSLKYLRVLEATATLSFGGIVTALLNLAFLGKTISPQDGIGFILIFTGILLMVGLNQILETLAGIKSQVTQKG